MTQDEIKTAGTKYLLGLGTNEISLMDVYRSGAALAQIEIDKLQAFKDFVHRRLDEMGVPTHPDGEHSKAGCRIGDRLDIIQKWVQQALEYDGFDDCEEQYERCPECHGKNDNHDPECTADDHPEL